METDTDAPLLRLGVKFSFLTKVVVRGELGDPELFLMPEVCFSGIFFDVTRKLLLTHPCNMTCTTGGVSAYVVGYNIDFQHKYKSNFCCPAIG